MAKTAIRQDAAPPPKGDAGDTVVLNIKGVAASAADQFRRLASGADITQAEALTALVGMYDAGERRDALEAEVATLEARRDQAKRETAQAITELEQAGREAVALREAATEQAAREVQLSRAAMDLLRSLVEMGASRDAVLRWGQALVAADIEPEQAARVMERVGGLRQLAEQLQNAVALLQEEKDQLLQQVSAARQAEEIVRARAQGAEKAISEVEAALAGARQQVTLTEALAREFGVYLDVLSIPGGRAEQWPVQVAMAVAGAVLFAALQAHAHEPGANAVLQLPPAMQMQRLLPTQIRLSELPTLLAPPAVYAQMLQAAEERDAMAAGMAAASAHAGSVQAGQ